MNELVQRPMDDCLTMRQAHMAGNDCTCSESFGDYLHNYKTERPGLLWVVSDVWWIKCLITMERQLVDDDWTSKRSQCWRTALMKDDAVGLVFMNRKWVPAIYCRLSGDHTLHVCLHFSVFCLLERDVSYSITVIKNKTPSQWHSMYRVFARYIPGPFKCHSAI